MTAPETAVAFLAVASIAAGIVWLLCLIQKAIDLAADRPEPVDVRSKAFFENLQDEVAETPRVEDHWRQHAELWPVQCAAILQGDMRCVGKAQADGLCRIHQTIRDHGMTVRVGTEQGESA